MQPCRRGKNTKFYLNHRGTGTEIATFELYRLLNGSGIFNSQLPRHNPNPKRHPLKRRVLIIDSRTVPFPNLLIPRFKGGRGLDRAIVCGEHGDHTMFLQ